jgi:hypothetical protein
VARETVDNCEEEHDPHQRHVILSQTEGKLSEGEGGGGDGLVLLPLVPIIERKEDREVTQRNYKA